MKRQCSWCGCRLFWWRLLGRYCRRCAYSDGGAPCSRGEHVGRTERQVWSR